MTEKISSGMYRERKPLYHISIAIAWFLLSTVITWWFIKSGVAGYHFDAQKMLLSCVIAGGKWGLQLIAALIFLQGKRWIFIRNIAFVCFAGSCVLLPYCFGVPLRLCAVNGFLLSLIVSVACMLLLYYRAVRNSGVPVEWYFFWIVSLALAICLQLTVVFDAI